MGVVDFTLGIVGNVLTSALGIVATEIQRKQQVYSAIQGTAINPTDTILNNAYSEVRQAFGRLGALDSDLEAFLSALIGSDVMRPLALAAWTGVSWKPLQYAVFSIYVGSTQQRSSDERAFSECQQLTQKIVQGIATYFHQSNIRQTLSLMTGVLPEFRDEAARVISETQKRWSLRDEQGKPILGPGAIEKSAHGSSSIRRALTQSQERWLERLLTSTKR